MMVPWSYDIISYSTQMVKVTGSTNWDYSTVGGFCSVALVVDFVTWLGFVGSGWIGKESTIGKM